MSTYIIKRECQCVYTDEKGCEACKYTGWRILNSTSDRKRHIHLFKHFKRFYGNQLKVKTERV